MIAKHISMKTCAFSALMGLLFVAFPASASYVEGAFGFFLVFYSIPVALIATIVSLILCMFGAFANRALAIGYPLVFAVAAASVVVLALRETESAVFAFFGEAILLVPVIAPGAIQYWYKTKQARAQEGG